MAAIDSLLRLMDAQGADGLVVAADEVPFLRKAGGTVGLSMPPIPETLVASFAFDLIGPEGSAAVGAGRTVEGTYRSGHGSTYAYRVEPHGHGCRLEMRQVGDRSNPPAAGGATDADRADPGLIRALGEALERGASDVFFSSGDRTRVRVGGAIEEIPGPAPGEDEILALAGPGMTAERRSALEGAGSVDLAVEMDVEGSRRRFRLSLFRHLDGLAAALRPVAERPPSLEDLNLPGDLGELGSYPNGLVLMTGAAGSGKSSTLAALVGHINETRACHIITIEDPIEFVHRDRMSMVHQREVGRHVESFSAGLLAALRESPDVILVGEMRDLATIAAALTAAETGHLVLSTLHTGDATSAVDRIIDVFPGHQQPQVRLQLASVLRAVVTQILVASTREPGRVPAIEKLVVTGAVACQIREGRNHQLSSLVQAGAAEGMITLERSLASLVRGGKVALPTALRHARDEEALRKLTRSA